MNKLKPDRNHKLDNITKLESSDNKLLLLYVISQENNKSIHYKIEKEKYKLVLKDLLKNNSESQEIHKPQEIYESSESYKSNSEFIINNEIEKIEEIENHLEFDNIYEKIEPEEIIYYDPNQAKLKTIAKILYSKNNLDQLIKKKKW